jgi:ABC-type transporter Mla subunit MlaD
MPEIQDHFRYGADQLASIDADISAMEDFAAGLLAELEKNFAPNAARYSADLQVEIEGGASFPELAQFLRTHSEVKATTYGNLFEFRGGTHRLASAAHMVGQEYRKTDAFSSAKVSDVEDALADPDAYKSDASTGGYEVLP